MVKAIQLVIAEEVEIPSETKEENQPQPPGFHLKLTPEGKRFLETLPEGVHIVGFTGDARQGKSTLACNMLRHLDPSIMNRVTKSEELFEARAGSDAVTSGIWIWPEVLRSEKYNNELFVVIDTEGTDKGDDNLTAQLTAVTCFLVSQLVLHVKSELGNSGLARLAALTHILGEASSADETSRAAVFPDLMVCARSVEDSWLVDQGFGEMDASGLADVKFGTNEVHEKGDKYLENKVFNTSLQDGHDGDRVQVLKMLKEQRFCFSTVAERRDRALLMVGKEAEKAGVNRVWSEFDEESPFSKSYHAAMDRIISTTPMKSYGQHIHAAGPTLVQAALMFVEHINENVVDVKGPLHFLHVQKATTLIEGIMNVATTESKLEKPYPSQEDFEDTFQEQSKAAIKSLDDAMDDLGILSEVVAWAKGDLRARLGVLKTSITVKIHQNFMEEANGRIEEANKAAQSAVEATDSIKIKLEAAEQDVRDANKKMEKVQKEADDAKKAAEDSAKSAKDAQAALERAGKKSKKKKGLFDCSVM